jgi:hypothetical protein
MSRAIPLLPLWASYRMNFTFMEHYYGEKNTSSYLYIRIRHGGIAEK